MWSTLVHKQVLNYTKEGQKWDSNIFGGYGKPFLLYSIL